MVRLPIVVPLGRGYIIPTIKAVGVLWDLHTINDVCQDDDKRSRIANTKNRCRDYALEKLKGYPYVLFHDSDLQVTDEWAFFNQIAFLEENPEYGAVALLRSYMVYQKYPKHICNGVTLFRLTALKDVIFGMKDNTGPTCEPMADSLVKAGWRYEYLNDKKVIKDLSIGETNE